MGFFSDLREDINQALNEITDDFTEQELLEEEALLKQELAEMEDEFQITGVEEPVSENESTVSELMEELVLDENEVDKILESDSVDMFEGVNEEVMATLSAGYATATENLPDSEEDNLKKDMMEVLENLTEEVSEVETDESAEDTNEDTEEVTEVEELEEIEEVTDMVQEETMNMSVLEEETFVSMADENAEVGIIPAGMMITGDIKTAGALDLRGTVLGNIDIGGKLNVSGSIQGNSKAVEIFAQAAKITGDIECDNSVKVGPNSVVIGNISARSAVIAGAVKGDIDVRGPVILDSSAIIKGNIKSKSVQINNGAAVEGMCSQCYADVNPSSFFDGLE